MIRIHAKGLFSDTYIYVMFTISDYGDSTRDQRGHLDYYKKEFWHFYQHAANRTEKRKKSQVKITSKEHTSGSSVSL